MTREQAEEMVNRYGRSCMDQVIGKINIREHFIVRDALIAALAPECECPCHSPEPCTCAGYAYSCGGTGPERTKP